MTIEPADVARHPPPLYRAIVASIDHAVAEGRLGPGERLPTVRDLATRLGVTIGTVNRAYQLAERRGLVRAEVGRGTFVRGPERERRIQVDPGQAANVVDLAVNAPPPLAEAAIAAALAEIARDPATAERLCTYAPVVGLQEHRGAAAAWLRERVASADAERTIIGTGAHSLLQAVLAAVTKPGETVLMERLTYPGARDVATGRQLAVEPVAIDAEGLVPDSLERVVVATGAQVLITLPNLHNPTTRTQPEERRRRIVEIARRHDLLVVEDDVYGRLLEDPPPSLADLAPERVVHLTSASKCLAPGLRVAVALVPERLVGPVGGALHDLIVASTPLTTELFTRLIASGAAREVETALRREAVMRDAMARRMLQLAPPRGPVALHLWLEDLRGWRADDLQAALGARGVRVPVPSTFSIRGDAPEEALRLGLGRPPVDALETALATLGDLLATGPCAKRRVI